MNGTVCRDQDVAATETRLWLTAGTTDAVGELVLRDLKKSDWCGMGNANLRASV